MAARVWGVLIFPIYLDRKLSLLVRKHWTDINITWQKCTFGDPFANIVQAIMIRQKIWLPGGGAYLPYIFIQKTFKICLTLTTGSVVSI